MKTALQVTVSSVLGLALIGLALFWPAGTFDYWQAWVFLGIFVVLSVIYTVYVGMKNPEVLRRRMNAGPAHESRPVQKIVSSGVVLMFFALLVVSALRPSIRLVERAYCGCAHRRCAGSGWAWHHHARSRAKQLCRRQYHRRSGPESGLHRTVWFVRHPMYFGGLVMLIGIPLALDSYWGLVVLAPTVALLTARISTRRRR